MDKNDAYIVLKDIGILNNQIDTIYQKLISYDEFYNLHNSKKIDLNDEEILIKYSINDVDEILKNKKIVSDNDESTKEHVEITPYKESFFIKIINRLKKIFSR